MTAGLQKLDSSQTIDRIFIPFLAGIDPLAFMQLHVYIRMPEHTPTRYTSIGVCVYVRLGD